MTSLEIADLERIVQTVRQESERLRGRNRRLGIGWIQRTAFLLLQLVAFSIPVTLGLLLFGIYLLNWGGSLQALLLLVWLIVVAPVLLILLILFNLPLVVTSWKQRRLILGRGLLVPAFPMWQRKARWIVLGLTVASGVLHFTVPAFRQFGGFIVVLLVVTFPFMLLMLRSFLKLAESNLALAGRVEELEQALEAKLATARQNAETHVDVPHELAVEISATTTSIFDNQRLRAIDASTRRQPSQYSVSQSAEFRESLGRFDPAGRLQILDRVQELATDRRPETARRDDASDSWLWTLSEPAVELVYQVSDERRQVLVRDLRPVEPLADGGSRRGG